MTIWNCEQREHLIKRINAAFDDVPYPGDEKLLPIIEISESPDIRREFTGKDWREISPGIGKDGRIHWSADALIFMSPEASRYFLPAFMISCIKDIVKADVIPYILISILHPPDETTSPAATALARTRFENFVGPITADQRNAIRDFLRYLFQSAPEPNLTADDARMEATLEALRSYWNIR